MIIDTATRTLVSFVGAGLLLDQRVIEEPTDAPVPDGADTLITQPIDAEDNATGPAVFAPIE